MNDNNTNSSNTPQNLPPGEPIDSIMDSIERPKVDSSFVPMTPRPRRELREEAFRKYEPYIARALKESFTVNTLQELKVKSCTFISRFRDAILGYRQFHYHSILFRHDANFEAIKLYELSDEFARIDNKYLPLQAREKIYDATADLQELRTIAEQLHLRQRDVQVFIAYRTDVERDYWLHRAEDGVRLEDGTLEYWSIQIKEHGPGLLVMRA